ncbi:MAG: toll/interleukin-1 receptor domain-containing protein [Xanthomonadales bacterium]|nr:toll/interleukin-1 receptor domain-containing protein [Xanthomonadales bacterium]
MRYKAFISYSHIDSKWAKWIQRALERYRIPAKLVAKHGLSTNRLQPIFLDRDELSSSSSLSSVIQDALEASEHLIVVCSPASAASRWVNEEVRTFQALGRGDRIFCLIVDGDDGTYFPPALYEDEPLGVDVRPQADGKQNAKLKLIASLVGVPFASLKDREQRRRTRVFATAAAAALVVSGVMTALAINAVLAGREAERSRVIATEALEDAQAVAEFLSTMLTEIDPEAMGETIVDGAQGDYNSTDLARRLLDEHVLEKATVAVGSQFAERPAIGARLSNALGASYHAIGLYGDAIEQFAKALELYRGEYGELDQRTVGAESWLGMSLLYEGRLDESVRAFENAVRVGRESLGRTHEETLGAMNGLAMAYTDMDRLEEGRDILDELSDLMIETKGREDLDTIDVRSNLAWNLYLLGDYEQAEEIFDEQYALRLKLLGPEAYETLSVLNNLALIYARTDRLEMAEAAHREEWEISQRTLGTDHPEVLISMLNLGRVTMRLGRTNDASDLLTDALARADRVLPPVHPLLAAISTACGEVALEQGDREQALERFLASRRIYEQMFEPGHPRFERLDDLIAQARS